MTMKRSGAGWMPAEEYGRSLPTFSVNLQGVEFMLHSDHTYDRHPLYERLRGTEPRGTGAELRVMGIDPDAVQGRAEAAGATIIQRAADFPHGWRDVMVADPDGYIWAVGVAK
jgi:uncharacterized glyoxalase superfamily protein PhnB